MKLLTSLVAMTLSLAAISQDATTTKTQNGKFQIGINYSSDYCYRTLENNSGSSVINDIIRTRNEHEMPVFGYSTGINIKYKISNRFSAEAGAQYARRGYGYRSGNLVYGDIVDPRHGFTTISSDNIPVSVNFLYHHYYSDIPARIIFNYGNKKMQFLSSVGVTTSIFLKATTTSIARYQNGDTKRDKYTQNSDYNPVDFSATATVGIGYAISDQFYFTMEPTVRYGLNNISNSPLGAKFWNAGLNFGCYYKL